MKEYVKEIAVLIILSKLVINLVPKKEFHKYVKLFLGTLMIVVLLKPIDYVIDLSGKLEESIENISFDREKEEIEANLKLTDEYIKSEAIKSYKDILKNEMEEIVSDKGFFMDNCLIELESTDDLKIKNIHVSVSEAGEINKNEDTEDKFVTTVDKVVIEIIETSKPGINNKYAGEREEIKAIISEKYEVSSDNVTVVYQEG